MSRACFQPVGARARRALCALCAPLVDAPEAPLRSGQRPLPRRRRRVAAQPPCLMPPLPLDPHPRAGQKRLTNIAVVRLKKGGTRFEIACYKNKARTVFCLRGGGRRAARRQPPLRALSPPHRGSRSRLRAPSPD